MKKLAFLVVALSTVFVACKKENDPAEKTTREKIIATWMGDKIVVTIEVPPAPPQVMFQDDLSYATIEFKSDGTLVLDSAGVKQTENWALDANENLVLDGDVFKIYTLTESNFNFGMEETDTISETPLVIQNFKSEIRLKK